MEKVFFDFTKGDQLKSELQKYVELIKKDEIIYKNDFIGTGKDDKEYKLVYSNIIENDGKFKSFQNKDKQLSYIEWSKIIKAEGLSPETKQSETILKRLGILPLKHIKTVKSTIESWNIGKDFAMKTDFFAIFFKDDKILGRCKSDIIKPKDYKDYGVPNVPLLPQEQDYIYISDVDMNPNYIGKGLCKPLLKFLIESIYISNPKYKYMFIDNASKTKGALPACMCYVKAGLQNSMPIRVFYKDDLDGPLKENPDLKHMATDKCLLEKKHMPKEYYYIIDDKTLGRKTKLIRRGKKRRRIRGKSSRRPKHSKKRKK